MASDEIVNGLLSLPASADLSTNEFYLVKVDTNGQLALTSTGEVAIGVLYDKPNAAGVIAGVHPLDGRKAKGIAGGNIAKGDLLKSDSAGKLATAVKGTVSGSNVVGSFVVGVAIDSAASGDFFQFIASGLGVIATTAA